MPTPERKFSLLLFPLAVVGALALGRSCSPPAQASVQAPGLVGRSALGAFGTLFSQTVVSETQPGTRAAPTLPTQGIGLGGTVSLHAIVRCSDGSNLTAGSENLFFYSQASAAWGPGVVSGNFNLPTGVSQAVGPELQTTNPFGRVLWASSGVTCSGGSWDGGVLVMIEAASQ
jgi:hypothetical protein